MPKTDLAGWAQWVVIVVALSGCDSLPTVSTRFASGLSADERAQAAQIPVYRERLGEGTYQLVGPVQGLSCQITHDDDYQVSEDNAIEELQRATFKAGANAVMDVACDEFGWRQGTRSCFRSFECRGTAIKTTE